jgi:excisionase family DNA binding protein
MSKTKEMEKYGLTVKEAVKVMGVCERMVRKLIAEDRMPYFMVGSAVRIPRQLLKDWMDNGGTNSSGKFKPRNRVCCKSKATGQYQKDGVA